MVRQNIQNRLSSLDESDDDLEEFIQKNEKEL